MKEKVDALLKRLEAQERALMDNLLAVRGALQALRELVKEEGNAGNPSP